MNEQDWKKIEELKSRTGWNEVGGLARKWWNSFENESIGRPALILKVLNELISRNAKLENFFYAFIYAKTDNIQEVLDFYDFTALRSLNHSTLKEEDFQLAGQQNWKVEREIQ